MGRSSIPLYGQKGLWRGALFKHKDQKLLKGIPTNSFQSVYSDFEPKKKKKKKSYLAKIWVDRVSGNTTLFFLALVFCYDMVIENDK